MAQLLIMDRDNTHPDPDIDRRGSWKRGMVAGAVAGEWSEPSNSFERRPVAPGSVSVKK